MMLMVMVMVTSLEQVVAPLVSVGRQRTVTKQEYYWEHLSPMLHKRFPGTNDYSRDFDLATPNLFERWVGGQSGSVCPQRGEDVPGADGEAGQP